MKFRGLSTSQKSKLGIVARAAWQCAIDSGDVAPPARGKKTASLDTWRKGVVTEETGNPDGSFRKVHNDQFCQLMGRFSHLAGDDAQAVYWYSRADGEHARQVAHSLHKAIERAKPFGIRPEYAAQVSADRFGTRNLNHLNPAQQIDIIKTINARRLERPTREDWKI